jgi:hypothetical protein
MRPLLLTLLMGAVALAAKDTAGTVTFHRDVLPVLQHNCQGCHRPGEAAPMSLLTYKETRPWAKAMREAVLLKKMPPWFADPHVGKFANDRSLAQKDIDTLVKWADSGAPEGDPNDAPKPVAFLDGWNIGTPDLVVEMPSEIDVPAKGTIEYTYYVMPTGFTEDKWVRMSEVRPGNRRVVHHVIAFVREPGSNWLKEAKPGVPYVPMSRRKTLPIPGTRSADSGWSVTRRAQFPISSSQVRLALSKPVPISSCSSTTPPMESLRKTAQRSALSLQSSRRNSVSSQWLP